MIVAGILVSLMQGIVRYLSLELNIYVIVFFRAFLAVLLISTFSIKIGTKLFFSQTPKLQFYRGFLGAIAMVCFFKGLSLITLAETTTIGFLVPAFATILAIIFYREKVGIRRWSAILIGFIGTIIVIRPDISIKLGSILILISTISWAGSVLITKKLTSKDSNSTIALWQVIYATIPAFFLAYFNWEWPDIRQFFLLIIIASLGTVAHLSINAAIKRGEISMLMPLDYLRLIWSIIIGYLLLGDLPTDSLLLGAFLIIISTGFITYREAKIKKN